MRIFSKPILRDFWDKHPNSKSALENWYDITKHAQWGNFAGMRTDFPSVDKVGILYVFNIGGNKYRLIAAVHFNTQRVFVRHILTHREYDRGHWKDG